MKEVEKEEITYGRLTLELDSSQIFKDDPGQGTPAMVYLGKKYASTYWWVSGEGNVDGVELEPDELDWINDQEDVVEEFMQRHLND